MPASHAIAIGASSGGLFALFEIVSALPSAFNAVIGVVMHVGSRASLLPELLSSRGSLPAVHPQDGEPLVPGTIYVAPPDYHLLFGTDVVRLNRGPPENHARPAIDPLFRSAALSWGPRAVGVVLTGNLDDGTAGLAAIKDGGGTAIVQDPGTAMQPGMPASALANVEVDHCLPLPGIAAVLLKLVGRPVPAEQPQPPQRLLREIALFERRENRGTALASLSFSARAFERRQVDSAEHALWSSLRALQEREILLRRLANVVEATGDPARAEVGRHQADLVRAQVEVLGRLVQRELNSA